MKRRRQLGLDEKNKKQKKRNTSNQQLLNEQAHKLNKASLNEGARLKQVAGTRI
jgi:hypothetical protein